MSLKQCVKCGQMADEAKAFCPHCSYSFDLEREAPTSEFELTSDTDTFTRSFFNEVLSDMELNISEAPDAPAKLESEPGRAPRGNLLKWIGAVCVFLLLVLITVILFCVLR